MAIYEFSATHVIDFSQASPIAMAAGSSISPDINSYIPGAAKLSDVEGGKNQMMWEENRVEAIDAEEALHPGFRYLDKALKDYWGDIRIPIGKNTEKYRFMRVKIAGAQRGLQIWSDELKNGRVKLPVASLSRSGHASNPAKYSPAYNSVFRQFTGPAMDRIKMQYRPVPYIVDYTLSIWSETKTDAEYALYQIGTRFNPLAELNVSDDHWNSAVQLQFGGISDISEKEGGSDSYQKNLYEVTFKAEAWLSLPEKVVPSILGVCKVLNEQVIRIGK